MSKTLWVFVLSFLVMGCSSGNCRRKPDSATQPVVRSPEASLSSEAPASGDKVMVYKYDQSKQCRGGGIPLETMEAQLESNGIRVFGREKRMDNLLHVQVCDAPTGRVNVYVIESQNLKKAEALGFQPWLQH